MNARGVENRRMLARCLHQSARVDPVMSGLQGGPTRFDAPPRKYRRATSLESLDLAMDPLR